MSKIGPNPPPRPVLPLPHRLGRFPVLSLCYSNGTVLCSFRIFKAYLESLREVTSLRHMEELLSGLSGMAKAYADAHSPTMERIITQPSGRAELAKRAFYCALHAKEDMKAEALRHAIAVHLKDLRLSIDNPQVGIPFIEDIISWCMGLLEIRADSAICFTSFTVAKYLGTKTMQTEWLSMTKDDMAATCITYLSLAAFESGMCGSDEELENRLDMFPLYQHAAQYWGSYVLECSPSFESESVLAFLSSPSKVQAATQAMWTAKREGVSQAPGYSQRVPSNVTGLHLAAHFGLADVVGSLLGRGQSRMAQDSTGKTPRDWAVANSHEDVAKLLQQQANGTA